eukprot:scaffold18450_cov68-Phaeocystis_antarctica.AAC.8
MTAAYSSSRPAIGDSAPYPAGARQRVPAGACRGSAARGASGIRGAPHASRTERLASSRSLELGFRHALELSVRHEAPIVEGGRQRRKAVANERRNGEADQPAGEHTLAWIERRARRERRILHHVGREHAERPEPADSEPHGLHVVRHEPALLPLKELALSIGTVGPLLRERRTAATRRAVWPMSARLAWSATRNETSGELKKKWYVHPATPLACSGSMANARSRHFGLPVYSPYRLTMPDALGSHGKRAQRVGTQVAQAQEKGTVLPKTDRRAICGGEHGEPHDSRGRVAKGGTIALLLAG